MFFLFALFFLPALSCFAADFVSTAKNQVRAAEFDNAIETLKAGLQADPRNMPARFLLGSLYFNAKDYGEAEAQYEAVLAVSPDNPQALNNLGIVRETTGDAPGAVRYFRLASKADQGFIPAHRNLAYLYGETGDYDDAIAENKILLRLDPESQTFINLALLYAKTKDYAAAEEALNNYLSQHSGDGKALQALSQVYAQDGKPGMAMDAASRALKLDPTNVSFLVTDGQAALAAGKLSRAMRDAQQALDLTQAGDPGHQAADDLFDDVRAAELLRRDHFLIALICFLTIFFSASLAYVWRYGGKREEAYTRMIEKWEEDLQSLVDLQEITDFLFGYFIEFFKLPKGMFFMMSREGSGLKCAKSNMKIILADSMDVDTGSAAKWLRLHSGKPMTASQAFKSSYFNEAFPNGKEVCEKHDIRLIIPFHEKGKVLAMLLLGGVTRADFRRLLPKARKNAEAANLLAQKAASVIETSLLYELSVVDEQTKVFNKRYFRQVLLDELKRVERYNQPCSLVMMDIDYFKQLNDSYGHPQGDVVLKELADILKQNVREGLDSVSRYGGEEFSIILPTTSVDKAREMAERIRLSVFSHSFAGLPPNMRVTVSIGIASYPDHANTDWELVKAADEALYQSKQSGRNRVTVKEFVAAVESPPGLAAEEPAALAKVIPPFRSFQFRFESEVRRAQAENYPVAVAVIKADGDAGGAKSVKLLPQIVSFAQPFLRVIDFYSSVEKGALALMFCEKSGKEAVSIVEQILSRAKDAAFNAGGGSVTLSGGVAVFPEDGASLDALVARAEVAREAASKTAGRVMAYKDVKQPV